MEGIIYLDTHAVIWLYSGDLKLFNKKVQELINENPLCISYIIKLELKFLYEIGRIKMLPDVIIDSLKDEIGLVYSNNNIEKIINHAIQLDFTRDPFDRIIVADALISNSYLVSKDQIILNNYKKAIW